MIKTWLQRLALAPAIVLSMAGAALAEPAMWVVKDQDSTIYLFGTVHVLKPQTQWRTARIEDAVRRSTELYLEILEPEDEAAAARQMTPVMLQHGMSPDKPLSSRLTTAEYARLQSLAKDAGMDEQTIAGLNVMRPWLAATILSVQPLIKAGYDSDSGVERVLRRVASGEGDQLKSLESVEQQLMFLATMPDDLQLQFLRQSLEDADVAEFDRLVDSWAAGDLSRLEQAMVVEMKGEAPELYEVLINRRNEDWAKQIEARLAGSGVSFIAVGAGHLVGPESLQVKLKARGITAERY